MSKESDIGNNSGNSDILTKLLIILSFLFVDDEEKIEERERERETGTQTDCK
jgi:hypothetical protein